MAQVLVVEDDALLRDQVVTYLALSGLEAAGVGSAAELYRRMAVERFTVLVRDLRLPDEDGVTLRLQGRNLGDAAGRNHVSPLKDVTPLRGREVRLVGEVRF